MPGDPPGIASDQLRFGRMADLAAGDDVEEQAHAPSLHRPVKQLNGGRRLGCGDRGGRSVADRILAILFPITAFVAIGFEHSIANWFFLPYGLLLDQQGAVPIPGAVRNIVAVTAGNIIGGTLLVAGVYWLAYLREGRAAKNRSA